MMVVGAAFTANLNADKIYIDITYLPDTVKNKFWLTIQNQSLVTLYFKIICNISNWSMDTPADGKLGSITQGITGTFTPIISRSKPGAETTDTGNLTIEGYTDSGYTNKIGEATLNVTVYFEDLENWTDVSKSDFDDGTAQGWTLAAGMSIANDESVEAGGYSARLNEFLNATKTAYVQKTITLPNRAKVRVSCFLAWRTRNTFTQPVTGNVEFRNVAVKVGDEKVFDIPFYIFKRTSWAASTAYYYGWIKITADLSAYKNQSKTVRIEWEDYNSSIVYVYDTGWLDRIVVAGKD